MNALTASHYLRTACAQSYDPGHTYVEHAMKNVESGNVTMCGRTLKRLAYVRVGWTKLASDDCKRCFAIVSKMAPAAGTK